MAHVDYPRWARFVLDVLNSHGLPSPNTKSPPNILECACGTGSITVLLTLYGYQLEAFDRSAEMVEIARRKAAGLRHTPRFFTADFNNFETASAFDAVLCLYDSVNYMLTEDALCAYFERVRKVVKVKCLFLFDVCTDINSRLHFTDRCETGQGKDYHYVRKMQYDSVSMMQENRFEITLAGQPEPLIEIHRQRIYRLSEIEKQLIRAGWSILEKTDEYRRQPAHKNSMRVHFLCRPKAI